MRRPVIPPSYNYADLQYLPESRIKQLYVNLWNLSSLSLADIGKKAYTC